MPSSTLGITAPRRMASPSCAPMGSAEQSEGAPPDWREVGPRVWPRYAAMLRIKNQPTADKFKQSSISISTTNFSVQGSVLLPDGRVYIIPRTLAYGYIYDPLTDTLITAGTFPGTSNQFVSGCLSLQGWVYHVPYGITTAYKFDPETGKSTTLTGTYPANAAVGAATLPDGRIITCAYGTVMQIYNPSDDTLTATGHTVTTNSLTLMPDGRVFMPPASGDTARIYDPETNTIITPSAAFQTGTDQYLAVLLSDSEIYCSAQNVTTARIYNFLTDTVRTPTGTFPGAYYMGKPILLPDSRVFIPPFVKAQTTARIYDPATDTLTTPSGTYTSVNTGTLGGTQMQDGGVFVPRSGANNSGIWYGGYTRYLPPARLLSQYFNPGT